VLLELPPEIVAIHFLVSIGLLAAATFAWIAAASPTRLRLVRGRARGTRVGVGVLMLASLLAVIVAGVLTTASGPHSGGASSGLAIDRFGIFGLAVTLHARGAYAFLVGLLLLSWWRRAEGGAAVRDLGLVIGLVVVQIALGEIQYRNGLPWGIVLAHVANAGLLWASAVRVAVGAAFEGGVEMGEVVSRHDDDHPRRGRPARPRTHALR
jgi:cytochrome c oxidase assembly protein subunit 15